MNKTRVLYEKQISDNPKGKTGHSNKNLSFVDLELRLAKQFPGRSMVDPRFTGGGKCDERHCIIYLVTAMTNSEQSKHYTGSYSIHKLAKSKDIEDKPVFFFFNEDETIVHQYNWLTTATREAAYLVLLLDKPRGWPLGAPAPKRSSVLMMLMPGQENE
jgi:hypothetical protein